MNIAEQVIRAKQDLDDVYKAGQSSMVDQSKLIPKTVSGNYISLDDVSEIPHSVGCKVESVNLFNNPTAAASGTSNGVSWTLNEDKSVTLNGKATATTVIYYQSSLYLKAGIYTLYGCPSEYLGSVYLQVNKFINGVGLSAANSHIKPTTFEISEDNTQTTTFIGILPNTTLDNATIYPMLNRGATALPYTPYVSPEEVTVTRTGKNLATAQQVFKGYSQYDETVLDGRNVIRYLTNESANNALPIFEENTRYTFSFDGKSTLNGNDATTSPFLKRLKSPPFKNCEFLSICLVSQSANTFLSLCSKSKFT